ncbi:MAG: SPFH domain-containing protein [Lachnospiraceae bacterium]|nr:SPFH domain-containing protein [Lachnospiraceae bacterium]
MGLIKMIGSAVSDVAGALGGGLGTTGRSMWQDYFESGDMSGGVIMKRGEKILGKDTRNKKGDPNIITSGSGIDIQENQCMILVENGKIVELCAEPGRYTYDSSAAPSFIAGDNKGLDAILSTLGHQIMAGGQRTNTERVYYINMGEIQGFKWGSGNISFQHVERDLMTDRPVWQCSTTLLGNGVYSIHVTDPLKFYQMLGSQVAGTDGRGLVTRNDIESQIKSEVISAIRQGIGGLSRLKIPYTDIASHEAELTRDVNEILSDSWAAKRGIELFGLAVNMLDPDYKSKEKINSYQETKGYTDPSMLAAYMGMGQTDSMKAAASNAKGAMQGFAGVGMMNSMNGAMGGNLASMMQMGQQQAAANQAAWQAGQAGPAMNWQQNQQGAQQTGMGYAQTAASPQNVPVGETWTCACGTVNTGNFCMNCGQKKPAGASVCSKCGWADPSMQMKPKFCPNCGNPL